LAETKATKAIQKFYEYRWKRKKLSNWWSVFTLGKARYYDQRFIPH
jgi:hypothetical protein